MPLDVAQAHVVAQPPFFLRAEKRGGRLCVGLIQIFKVKNKTKPGKKNIAKNRLWSKGWLAVWQGSCGVLTLTRLAVPMPMPVALPGCDIPARHHRRGARKNFC
ncbi:hypothetical protein I7I50_08332 [Histoplasma capsulatum G186AR]|uniref:Uncharacterized protein n=1 Tax=Ajellomyces capsulatus TaxID=5037 RepID=A0A8H8CZ68_AJECA|nr:hypothetical protein I7I52_05848 [Histoplasma capsulatum]QSS73531.1 hypothetical protein I7I50_08332 [Histoplasma capsulatum G186AR]